MRPTRALRQDESIKPPSKASEVSHLLELLRPERSPHTFLSGTLILGGTAAESFCRQFSASFYLYLWAVLIKFSFLKVFC